jgi:hypothetical protein
MLGRSLFVSLSSAGPEGVFHPKVWVLRFLAQDGVVRYRILCLSRNLTFDRCWDTVVALDGELLDRSNAIAVNHTLADFVAARSRRAKRASRGQNRHQHPNPFIQQEPDLTNIGTAFY